jgi:thioesterase domain-containing protein
MARIILARGEAVALLALLDTRAPGIPRRLVSRDLVYQLRQRVEFHSGNLSTLSPQAKLRYLVQRTAAAAKRLALGGIYLALYQRARSQPAWLRPIQSGYRLAILARKKYTPGPYPGRITLFRATRQPSGMEDPTLGWGGVALGGVDILEIPGTHVSIMAEPALTALAGAVRRSLENVHRTLDGYPPT